MIKETECLNGLLHILEIKAVSEDIKCLQEMLAKLKQTRKLTQLERTKIVIQLQKAIFSNFIED